MIRELNESLERFRALTRELQDTYEETGGEITPDTELLEQSLEDLKAVLLEAPNDLGRWLKSKEAEAKAAKAEKEFCARRQKSAENSVVFIKRCIREVMDALGEDTVAGSLGYKFKIYDSTTTSANKELIRMRWQEKAEKALADAGIPDYITVTLGGRAPKEGELPDVFDMEITPTVKFFKPAEKKEEEEV